MHSIIYKISSMMVRRICVKYHILFIHTIFLLMILSVSYIWSLVPHITALNCILTPVCSLTASVSHILPADKWQRRYYASYGYINVWKNINLNMSVTLAKLARNFLSEGNTKRPGHSYQEDNFYSMLWLVVKSVDHRLMDLFLILRVVVHHSKPLTAIIT